MTSTKRRFLSDDHIYRDLTIALALLFLVNSVVDAVTVTNRSGGFLTAAFLLYALFVITRRPSHMVVGLALGIPAVASGVLNAFTPDSPKINAVPVVFAGLFLGFLVWRILKDVFSGARISSEQVFGAVCAYLLIGFLFATIYGFISLVNPNAFALSDGLAAELGGRTVGPSLTGHTYFSFVTMTTLGYGDITPVSTAARSFAWLQAVVGQLYIAITIAGLVGIHIARRDGGDEST